MSSKTRGLLAALIGVALASVAGETLGILERADELLFDAQARMVRAWRESQAALPERPQVVIVGVDDASLAAVGVPMAMLHGPLGTALQAIAAGDPLAIGLDIALPERSFDRLLPGLDRELMRGLLAARAKAGIVLVLDVDGSGRARIPPTPLLAAAGGSQAFGLALFPIDCDGVVRRFDPDPAARAQRHGSGCSGEQQWIFSAAEPAMDLAQLGLRPLPEQGPPTLPTFAASVARGFGRESELARPGWIDFTRGAAFSYVPLIEVLVRYQSGDIARLQELFGGQIVLLGSVLPDMDRLQLPVALSAWEFPGAPQPGVILTAQVLRNASGSGLLRPAPAVARVALLLAMVSVAFLGGPWMRWWALAGALVGAFAVATALHAHGWVLAPAHALVAAASAVIARTALDLADARRERERVSRALGGYLSPGLLRALIKGSVDTSGTRRAIALLFADLRGFTAWSERADPGLVRDTLNRYYTAITPLLHALGGTIDNFRGDGIMVMFGAPQLQQKQCDSAFAAARQILEVLARFNESELALRGMEPFEVCIGLAYGEVIVGDVGSSERKDYTALGDAVNVAARLQELAGTLGVAVLMTRAFSERLSRAEPGLRDLGEQALKGHSPVAVCSWTPAHLQNATQGTMQR
ncbi:MAG TPA: adenylate/guanylate cyclase domain-containing protein [Burkholderiaceae bacterium]|nr:adenylate/guanylate cyclase domain-containing protein [Burkholderiaceae bacterium]